MKMKSEKLKRFIANGFYPVRYIILKILKSIQRDINIKHPFSKLSFVLNSYKHKGYWYYGKSREQSTMSSFEKLICEGDMVVEVGGHIGFITHYFSYLVGQSGNVVVFEPGKNNIPYIEKNINILQNVSLVKKGCGNSNTFVQFFQDNITGQNNSVLSDYSGLNGVAISHGEIGEREIVEIELVRLDDYLTAEKLSPNFMKIDVEGFEFEVLQGLGKCLGKIPNLMIEVTENLENVTKLLKKRNYKLLDDDLNELKPTFTRGNIFAVLS